MELARLPYHSGRSADASAALAFLQTLCPGSPVTLVGYSLGGNIAMKLAGESGASPPPNLLSVLTVCPPADLSACSAWIGRRMNRVTIAILPVCCGAIGRAPRLRRMRCTLIFRDRRASCANRRLVHSADLRFRHVRELLSAVRRRAVAAGDSRADVDHRGRRRPVGAGQLVCETAAFAHHAVGHYASRRPLGFHRRRGTDADRRWIDWRVVDWVIAQHSAR